MENNTIDQNEYLKGAVETLLFVSDKPVSLEQLKTALEVVSIIDIRKIVQTLTQEYQTRQSGLSIIEIAGGYQMLSNPSYASYVRNFFKTKQKEKLSKPALECLAIVAYRQPVTRAEIELIRGVNSDGTVTHLLEKELIKVMGRKEIPGKPYLYGTTKQFLEYFGLKALEDLPKLEEFPALQKDFVAEGQSAEIAAETAQENSSSTSATTVTEEAPQVEAGQEAAAGASENQS
jgi:segregation and condensation protein B